MRQRSILPTLRTNLCLMRQTNRRTRSRNGQSHQTRHGRRKTRQRQIRHLNSLPQRNLHWCPQAPSAEIGKMVQKEYPDVIFAVDAVSSMAGDKTLPQELNCDIVFGSTQKCFALPPGLAVALVADRAIERAKTSPQQRRLHRPSRHL